MAREPESAAAEHQHHLQRALVLADNSVRDHAGSPFGAVLVRHGRVLAEAVNTIHEHGDPTAHAEIEAIRAATRRAGDPRLDGATMYASGYPCPMCLAAMYFCGIERAYYACSQEDAEPHGLSTSDIYRDLTMPAEQRRVQLHHLPVPGGPDPYRRWSQLQRQQ